jgi:tetratricopeptide (TPR) repeat protein
MSRGQQKPGNAFWAGVLDSALGEEAEKHIAEQQAALAADPADPRPCFHLGLLYHMQGKTAAAIEMFERALALDPEFALAHQHLGQIYALQGDYARARAHAREAAAHGNTALLELLQRYPPSGPARD